MRAAAAGSSQAVAALLRRYEELAFNVAYRITGAEDDGAEAARTAFLDVVGRAPEAERSFGARLLTATCSAGYAAMDERRRAAPGDGDGSAERLGADGGADAPPLLENWEEEIRDANSRLPVHQRELLALRDLAGLPYGAIAETMQISPESVPSLLAAARIQLRDELRGSELAREPMASEDCEAALELMTMRDDAELADDSADGEWLIAHLVACHDCRALLDAMQDARLAYTAWEPIAPPAKFFAETMAETARGAGHSDGAAPEWIDEPLSATGARATSPAREEATRSLPAAPRPTERQRRRRREVLLAGGWGAVLLTALLAVLVGGVFGDAEGEDKTSEPTLEPPARAKTPTAARKPMPREPAKKRHEEPEQPPGRPAVVQQPTRAAPVIVVAPPAPRRTEAAPRSRSRRPRAEQPRTTPPASAPAPRQQAPDPGGTAPPAPTNPAPPQRPPAGCPNPGAQPVPC